MCTVEKPTKCSIVKNSHSNFRVCLSSSVVKLNITDNLKKYCLVIWSTQNEHTRGCQQLDTYKGVIVQHSRTFKIIIDHFPSSVPALYSAKICSRKAEEPAYNENGRACLLLWWKWAWGVLSFREIQLLRRLCGKWAESQIPLMEPGRLRVLCCTYGILM